MRTSGSGWVIFQAEGTANAKTLRQDIAWVFEERQGGQGGWSGVIETWLCRTVRLCRGFIDSVVLGWSWPGL